MASVSELLKLSAQLQLTSDSARLDCELLLCHILDVDRSWLLTWPDHLVSSTDQAQFEALLQQRRQGVPIAYLIGTRGFWSMNLNVSADTLIPRPETELLVQAALDLDMPSNARGLDLGTGTGAIVLALASERSDMCWTAVDSQQAAVELAQCNCRLQQLANVKIFQSSWFDALEATDNRFDLIISNPPYIAVNDPHLTQGDVRFEPSSALVSGIDGLDDIKTIIRQSPTYLNSQGWLILEHGYNQGQAVNDLMQSAGFIKVDTRQDYNNLDRITLGQWR